MDAKKTRLNLKSQLPSQEVRKEVVKKASSLPVVESSQSNYTSLNPLTPRLRVGTEVSVFSAVETAERMDTARMQIYENQKHIELGMRYHMNPLFQKGYDVYAKCRNAFGSHFGAPSLPNLLDMQQKSLFNYSTCLHNIGTYVNQQHGEVSNEIDLMESQLVNYEKNLASERSVALREQIENAQTHAEQRKALSELYSQKRKERAMGLSQDFFNQYVSQEALLADVKHSLHLLEDQTILFETYIAKSKGFFVMVSGIGEAVTYMSPIVDKMKQQTAQLQIHTHVVTNYLQQQSDQPLFFPNTAEIAQVRGQRTL